MYLKTVKGLVESVKFRHTCVDTYGDILIRKHWLGKEKLDGCVSLLTFIK